MAKAKKTEGVMMQGSPEQDESFLALRAETKTVTENVSSLQVDTDEAERNASLLRSRIKELQKALKARLDFFVGPAKAWVKQMTDFFKVYSTDLDKADGILATRMIAYHNAKEAEARKAQEEADRKAALALAKGKVPAPMPMAPAPVETAVRSEEGQTVYTKHWTFEITDPNAVPRLFCQPVDLLLRQALTAGVRNIPGVRIFEETRSQRR